MCDELYDELKHVFKTTPTPDGGKRLVSKFGKCVVCGHEGNCFVLEETGEEICCLKCLKNRGGREWKDGELLIR